MLYRDELEEGGMARDDVDAAVAERRAELLAEAERDLDSKAAAGKAERDRSARCATSITDSHQFCGFTKTVYSPEMCLA